MVEWYKKHFYYLTLLGLHRLDTRPKTVGLKWNSCDAPYIMCLFNKIKDIKFNNKKKMLKQFP